MNCQKCRAPLKLDRSLQDLNSAALDLLVGSNRHIVDQNISTSRVPYPPARKELYDDVSKEAGSPVYKRTISGPPPGDGVPQVTAFPTKTGPKENPDMSFVLLTESQMAPALKATDESGPKGPDEASQIGEEKLLQDASLSRQAKSAQQLFEILSSQSDVDHPLCSECTDLLLSSLQTRLNASTNERDAYISFLKSLNNHTPATADISAAKSALESAKSAQDKAFADLLALEGEKALLDDQIAHLEAQSLALDEEERTFWQSRNAFALEFSRYHEEHDALNAAYEHDAQQLERLQRTNVYNDTFSIGHDGFFGTINGLRLGRLPPPQNVDWSEINAAWGTAALLLATVADKLEFAFKGYKIKPMGSNSTIEKFDAPSPQQSTTSNARSTASAAGQSSHQAQPKVTILDLFSSGDLPLGRMLLHRRLDAGMVAFLECLRQLGDFVQLDGDQYTHTSAQTGSGPRGSGATRVGLHLPYAIRKDKIGDTSIKLSVSTDEAWTRACKYALTCCKYLLAHASNVVVPVSDDSRSIRV